MDEESKEEENNVGTTGGLFQGSLFGDSSVFGTANLNKQS